VSTGYRSLAAAVIPATAIALGTGFVIAKTSPSRGGDGALLFTARFPATGLVTNEYAYWNPNDLAARRSRQWQMDSGSLFAREGQGYTGVPDACDPDRLSQHCTDSAIFRLATRRRDFRDVRVSFRLRLLKFVTTQSTPAVAWDGVHIWLRYRTQRELYYASAARRDGHIDLKKKCPGGPDNGGTYYYLADRVGFPVAVGATRTVAADALDEPDGSVRIRMLIGGRVMLSARDRGVGCAPLRGPGRVGIRGDDSEFLFGAFRVSKLS
jgi:hypothetical protein